MKRHAIRAALVVGIFAVATPAIAAPDPADKNPLVWRGHKYCWYDSGWNCAGWYRCGYENKAGKGWGGPQSWQAALTRQSSGAWFERPPPCGAAQRWRRRRVTRGRAITRSLSYGPGQKYRAVHIHPVNVSAVAAQTAASSASSETSNCKTFSSVRSRAVSSIVLALSFRALTKC